MIAARLLLERGQATTAAQAIGCVRAVRPDAIENVRQEQYLERLAQSISQPTTSPPSTAPQRGSSSSP
jgi:hypothetical protein